ncbi:MAG: hypothetical protein ACI87E_001822 [Mariniblastus sp.]|jgi:hypothetical protein
MRIKQLKFLALWTLLFGIVALPTTESFGQAWKAEVGFTALQAEKGAALEDGAGLAVMQAEAPDGDGDYLADITNAQFSGKTFTEGSGASGANGHATSVGLNFYGNTNSMSPGITNITGFDANGYLGTYLGANTGADPNTTAFDIGNHSYVGRASAQFTAAIAENLLERVDFVVNRDNTIMVVGADNGSGSATPRVLAPSYNSITVGLSSGNHSQTLTPNYGAPRFATQLVVPSVSFTSFSTPVVSSAAAILRQAGAGTNFIQNEVIRATLFAGATKDEFASWDRTAARPMDEVFGFGELNILNSYHIFEGGEFAGSTTDPASDVGLQGWDYDDFNGSDDLFYDFSIGAGLQADVSAVLSWNMEITDINNTGFFTASRNLADLNLHLFDSSGSFMGNLLDSSDGTDYNNEHIYMQGLAAGDYTFRVSGDSATDFGFAWNVATAAVPEPSSLAILGLIATGLAGRRRRKS